MKMFITEQGEPRERHVIHSLLTRGNFYFSTFIKDEDIWKWSEFRFLGNKKKKKHVWQSKESQTGNESNCYV